MKYEMKCYAGSQPRIEVTEEFVAKHGFKINPDAAKEIMESKGGFGFDREVAIYFLSYTDVREKLNDSAKEKYDADPALWKTITDVNEAVQDFLDYMVFGWTKAMDERGLSAGRTIEKLSAWMKILSRPDIAEILNNENRYAPYGRPALKDACDALEIIAPDYLWKDAA